MKRIILASNSIRRRELLKKAGLKFDIVESGVDEHLDPKLDPEIFARDLSFRKAKAVSDKFKNAIVIGADTFVLCEGKIIGKPKDLTDAKDMLTFLNGKTHEIVTGYTIIDKDTGRIITRSNKTIVSFRNISNEEIDEYLKTDEPFDKAGAYAIQGIAKKFVSKIKGDMSSAIGLPVKSVLNDLKSFGVL